MDTMPLTRMEMRVTEPHVIDARSNRKTPRVHVVVGDGDHAGKIKSVPIAYGNSCPFLKGSWGLTSDGDKLCREVNVPMNFAKRGWFILEKAYEAEGNSHGLEQWLSFQDACRMGRAFPKRGESDAKHGDGTLRSRKYNDDRIVPGFPDELLPKAVLECLRKRDPEIDAWQPDLPESKPGEKRKA